MDISNEKLLQGARNLKDKGYSQQQVNDWLMSHGSSLDDMRAFAKQSTPSIRPLTEDQKARPKGVSLKDLATSALKGWGEGIENLSNNMANTMTFGGTGWLDRQAGGEQAKLREELQARANAEGLGKLNKAGEFAYDVYGFTKGLPKMLATKIADKGIKGVKALGLNAGIGGAAFGTTSSDRLRDVPRNAIANAILAEVLGFGLAGGAKGGKFLMDAAMPYRNAVGNAIDKTVEKIGLNKLRDFAKTASQKGRNIIEVGDDELLNMTQEARQKTPKAKANIDNAVADFRDTQDARNAQVVNDAFGSRGKYENTDDIVKLAQEQAQPIYDKLQNVGDLAEINPQVARNIVRNPFLMKEVTGVMNDPLYQAEYMGQKVSPTDWKVVDQVNRSINDKISTAVRSGEADKVRLLEKQKYNLLNSVDEAVPEYKVARGIYEAEHKALKAQKIGEDALFDNNTSAEKLARTMKDMADYEKASLKVGAREKLLNNLESRENQAMGLKKLNNEQTRGKLKLVLGDEAQDVINYADDEINAMRNLNKLIGNSKTSEWQKLRDLTDIDVKVARRPWEIVGTVLEGMKNRVGDASNDVLTQMLTERGGGRLTQALDDYLTRSARAEQLRNLIGAVGTIGANRVMQIK